MATMKQKKFADKYLETGNGRHSVIGVYDVKSPEVADVIASENLRKPKVIEYMEENAEPVAKNMVKLALNAESESVQFQASKDILDRAGYKPVEKSQSIVANIDINVKDNPKAKKLAEEYEAKLKDSILSE